MPWQKGQSGNPQGAPKKKDSMRSWLQRVGRKRNEGRVTRDERVIDALYTKAEAGDLGAIRMILEFRVGKSAPVEVSPPEDKPVKMYIGVSPDDWPDPVPPGRQVP